MKLIRFGLVAVFVTLLLASGFGTCAEYKISKMEDSSVSSVAEWSVDGRPDGIAVGPDGGVYVGFNSEESSRITKYTPEGVMQTEWNVPGVIETNGIVVGPEGDVFISIVASASRAFGDRGLATPGSIIQVGRYSSNGELISEFSVDGVIETNGIVVNPASEIYLGANGDTVIKFGPEGNVLTSWSIEGTMSGIATDSAGNILVSFSDSPRVEKFSPEGDILEEFTVDGVIETNGIVVGPEDIILISDLGYKVFELNAEGGYLADWSVDGAISGMAVSPDGLLYIANSAGNFVLVYEI